MSPSPQFRSQRYQRLDIPPATGGHQSYPDWSYYSPVRPHGAPAGRGTWYVVKRQDAHGDAASPTRPKSDPLALRRRLRSALDAKANHLEVCRWPESDNFVKPSAPS